MTKQLGHESTSPPVCEIGSPEVRPRKYKSVSGRIVSAQSTVEVDEGMPRMRLGDRQGRSCIQQVVFSAGLFEQPVKIRSHKAHALLGPRQRVDRTMNSCIAAVAGEYRGDCLYQLASVKLLLKHAQVHVVFMLPECVLVEGRRRRS